MLVVVFAFLEVLGAFLGDPHVKVDGILCPTLIRHVIWLVLSKVKGKILLHVPVEPHTHTHIRQIP